MEFLEIIYGVLRGLLTEAIIRVIESRGEIKEKLTTSFLMKLNKKKSKMELTEILFSLWVKENLRQGIKK